MEYIGIISQKLDASCFFSDNDITIYELNYDVVNLCLNISHENIICNQKLLSWCNKYQKYDAIKLMCSEHNMNLESFKHEIDNIDLLFYLHVRGLDISIKKNPRLLLNNIQKENISVIDYILQDKLNSNADLNYAILESCKIGNIEIFKMLTKKKFDVNFNNNIFLLTAAEYGHLDIIQLLLESNANIFINNYSVLFTPLDI